MGRTVEDSSVVAPPVGARVEILPVLGIGGAMLVAPPVGARVEILGHLRGVVTIGRRPSRGGASRNKVRRLIRGAAVRSPLPWGRE